MLRGISPILGTIIISIITLGIFAALLYAFSYNIIGIITLKVKVSAAAQILVNSSSGEAYLQYFLVNGNNFYVHITHINVANQTTISVNITLKPGETYENVIRLPSTTHFQIGNYYTVVFVGYTAFGTTFSVNATALAINMQKETSHSTIAVY